MLPRITETTLLYILDKKIKSTTLNGNKVCVDNNSLTLHQCNVVCPAWVQSCLRVEGLRSCLRVQASGSRILLEGPDCCQRVRGLWYFSGTPIASMIHKRYQFKVVTVNIFLPWVLFPRNSVNWSVRHAPVIIWPWFWVHTLLQLWLPLLLLLTNHDP